MEDSRIEQEEAIQVLADLQPKVIANTEILIEELKGDVKPDTSQLLKSVTDAINWEVAVLSKTLSLINEKEERLDKDEINQAILALSDALRSQDNAKIADALENEMLPVMKRIRSVL